MGWDGKIETFIRPPTRAHSARERRGDLLDPEAGKAKEAEESASSWGTLHDEDYCRSDGLLNRMVETKAWGLLL